MVEQSAVNRWVVGSSPTSGASDQVVGGQRQLPRQEAEMAQLSENVQENQVSHELRR